MLHPVTLKNEIAAVNAVKEFIAVHGHADDESLLHDSIEGQTSFLELMAILLDETRHAEAMEEATGERMKKLGERKKRYGEKAEKLRALMLDSMRLTDMRKLELVEGTLSIGAARASVIITDEAALPDDCVKIERRPDRTAIKKKLDAGEAVPGAVLSNGGESLTIRAK
jgi:Siphovirus Gp157